MISEGFVLRKVKRVIDGDTFDLYSDIQGAQRIRIADVDAPKIGEHGYQFAADKLRELIEGKKIGLKPKRRDESGSLFADVMIDDRDIITLLRITQDEQ
ncbi:MAG: thermonuclease family protein [Candidatus Kariarchaeaceae archaeon]|jgi:endonuclease YncB( thermonuclease family)